MTRGFFGGDTRYSHFVASAPHGDHTEYNRLLEERQHDAARAEFARVNAQRKADLVTLRSAGFKTRYRQYRNDDEAAKARAKALAEADAAHWEKKTGIKLNVAEGFFL